MADNTSVSEVNSLLDVDKDNNINAELSDDEVVETARDCTAHGLFKFHQEADEQQLVEDFAVAKSTSFLEKDLAAVAVPTRDVVEADEETESRGSLQVSFGSEILETALDKDQAKEEKTLSSLELSDWYLRTLLSETVESTKNDEDNERSSVSFDDSQYSCGVYILEAGTVKYGHHGDESMLQFDISIDGNRNEEVASGCQQELEELVETTAIESPFPNEEVEIDEVCEADSFSKLASSSRALLELFVSAIIHFIRRYLF